MSKSAVSWQRHRRNKRYRSGLKTTQADAKSSQTSVYTSRSNYGRIQKLYENDNVSLSEFEQARGNYETALAQLQAAKSRITTETTKLRVAEVPYAASDAPTYPVTVDVQSREEQDSLTILMRNRQFTSQALQDLENTNVFVQSTGKAVPLSQVARIIPQWDYAKIMHYDLSRSITITSEIRDGVTASEITAQIRSWLDEQAGNWPPGYRYELGGDAENTQENMASVTQYLPLSGCIVFLPSMCYLNYWKSNLLVETNAVVSLSRSHADKTISGCFLILFKIRSGKIRSGKITSGTKRGVNMQLINKILCATDVSRDSSHLLSFGIDFCIRFDASFLIFHAVPPPHGSVARKIEFERGGEKQKQIKSAQAKIKTQMAGCTIKWESVITYGDPVLETAKEAKETKPDMVMAESLGLSGFQQFFSGSVVGDMAQTVMCPFLVIPPGKTFSETNHTKLKFTHIIVACGLTASDSHLKKYALAFLEHFDSTIHLVHVMESPLNERVVASTSAPYEQVQSRLEKTLSVQLKKMMPGKTKILHGVPGEELALYARNHGIDLIIAGIDDHPGRITPSTTASLIRHLPCALLTIPLSR